MFADLLAGLFADTGVRLTNQGVAYLHYGAVRVIDDIIQRVNEQGYPEVHEEGSEVVSFV